MSGSQRIRTSAAIAMVVIGAIVLVVASTGWWLERSFLNGGHFTSKANEIVDQREVQRALTEVLVGQLSHAAGTDLRIAQPFVDTVVSQVVQSGPFQAVFDKAVEAAHRVFTDRSAGEFVLNLAASYQLIKGPLQQVAPKLARQLPGPDKLKFVILARRNLRTIWDTIDQVKRGVVALSVTAVVLLAAGIAMAIDRWRVLAVAGWVTLGALALLLAVLFVTPLIVETRIHNGLFGDAFHAVFRVVTQGLVVQSIAIAVLGAAVALAARFTARHGVAAWRVAARDAWQSVTGLIPEAVHDLEVRPPLARVPRLPGAVVAPRVRHSWRAAGLLAVGLFAVIEPDTVGTVAVVLLGVVALYLAAVEGLVAWRAPHSAPPMP